MSTVSVLLMFSSLNGAPGNAGVVPTMDVVETASSNASSEDLAMFDDSPKGAKLDGLWSSHDAVSQHLHRAFWLAAGQCFAESAAGFSHLPCQQTRQGRYGVGCCFFRRPPHPEVAQCA